MTRDIYLEHLRGEDSRRARLSNQQVRAIRRMSKEGQSLAEIARVFECSRGHVCNIVKGRVRRRDGV